MRNYLEPCLSTIVRTQFMDDIGYVVKSTEQLIPSLQLNVKCLRRSELKLSPDECVFVQKNSFVRKCSNKRRSKRWKTQNQKLLQNNENNKISEAIGMPNFLPTIHLQFNHESVWTFFAFLQPIAEKCLNWIYKWDEICLPIFRENLETTTTQTLWLGNWGLQYVSLCDNSNHSSWFVLKLENDVRNNKVETVTSYAPVSFWSMIISTVHLKMSKFCMDFLSLNQALELFSHFKWGNKKPVLALTDKKNLTRFLPAKAIPPSLCNYVDQIIGVNWVVTNFSGKTNAAAVLLSPLKSNANKTKNWKWRTKSELAKQIIMYE